MLEDGEAIRHPGHIVRHHAGAARAATRGFGVPRRALVLGGQQINVREQRLEELPQHAT